MTCVKELCCNTVCNNLRSVVREGYKLAYGLNHIGILVQGLPVKGLAQLGSPLGQMDCVGSLNLAGVHHYKVSHIPCCSCTVNIALVFMLRKKRNKTAVVVMGMGQHHSIQNRGIEIPLAVLPVSLFPLTLESSAVYKYFSLICKKEMAGTGNLSGSSL